MIKGLRRYRAITIVLFLYSFVQLIPEQSAEVFRNILSTDASLPAMAWTVFAPTAMLALVVAMVSLLVLESDPAPEDETPGFGVALATALPFFVTGLALRSATVNQAAELKSKSGILAIALILVSFAVLAGVYHACQRHSQHRLLEGRRNYAYWGLILAWATLLLWSVDLAARRSDSLVAVSRGLAPLLIIDLFCAALVVGLALLTHLFRHTRWPVLTSLVAFVAILNLTELNNNHRVRSLDDAAVDTPYQLVEGPKLEQWVGSRSDVSKYDGEPYPVFVVAAQGGGSYAAYHSATVLARLYDTWPAFGEHLFAVSGVSGGSVGSALAISLSRELSDPSFACKDGKRPRMVELVERFWSDDHLSPLLFMGLFPDFIQRLVPARIDKFDRALGLERSLELTWDKMAEECGFKRANPFRDSLQSLNWTAAAQPNIPALFFNATNVANGGPVVLSTTNFTNYLFSSAWSIGELGNVRLSTASVLSARFPLVTASGWYRGYPLDGYGERLPDQQTIYLDDGGIYENSGTELLSKIAYQLRYLNATISRKIIVYCIVIGDAGYANDEFKLEFIELRKTNPGTAKILASMLKTAEGTPPIGAGWFSNIDSPVWALLQSRQYRAREAVKQSLRLAGQDPWSSGPKEAFSIQNPKGIVFPLDPETPDMPLGWLLSKHTRERLAARSGAKEKCSMGVDFPAPHIIPAVNSLAEMMKADNEGLAGAINNWQANCSQKSIVGLAR